MGEALFELEQSLRSSKITREEAELLNSCKGNALRSFTISTCITSAVGWIAFRKLGYGYRLNLSGGAALLCGMWRFDRSLYSCINHILAMEGSRMQKELANIILLKHRHDPKSMQLIDKHFYSEKVFDDSSSDRPISRWRNRSYFSDGVDWSQRSRDTEANDDNTSLELKQNPDSGKSTVSMMRPGIEISVDPLGCVFGYSKPPEEIHLPDTSSDTTPRRRARSHRRTQRRHRTRHTEASSDTGI